MTDNYPRWAVLLAQARGYDEMAHIAALGAGDEDAISLTHPYNWLTEEEVESITSTPRVCTSDDPTNHQGDTCPVHEGGILHPYETPERGHESAATDRRDQVPAGHLLSE